MGWEEGDPRKDGVGGPRAGRLPTSAFIAQRGHGARPGHLPGPLCTEVQARPRGKPGPKAVAAWLRALASRGPSAAVAAEGRPHPGTRVRPAPEPTDREAAGGARGPSRALVLQGCMRLREVAPGAPLSPWPPRELSLRGGRSLCLSRGAHAPLSSYTLVLILRPLHLRPPWRSAHVRGAQVQGSGYPSRGAQRSRSPQLTGGQRVRPRLLQGAVVGNKRFTNYKIVILWILNDPETPASFVRCPNPGYFGSHLVGARSVDALICQPPLFGHQDPAQPSA